jgi:hypothetical protein
MGYAACKCDAPQEIAYLDFLSHDPTLNSTPDVAQTLPIPAGRGRDHAYPGNLVELHRRVRKAHTSPCALAPAKLSGQVEEKNFGILGLFDFDFMLVLNPNGIAGL